MAETDVHGARTDVAFWDAQWSDRSQRSGLAAKLRSADFGQNGIFLKTMKRHAAHIFDNASVIELGGASSRFAIDLAIYANCKMTIVDNSEVGIEMSKRMFAEENADIRSVFADIFDLSLMDGAFDVVTHWGLMEHFNDAKSIFDISAQLLKPGGHLVYSMPNMGAIGAKLWKRHAPANFEAHIFHSDDALQTAATLSGFEKQRPFFFGVPLVRMAPAERNSVSALAANTAHAAMLAAGLVVPELYSSGSSRLASNRGFVLRKIT